MIILNKYQRYKEEFYKIFNNTFSTNINQKPTVIIYDNSLDLMLIDSTPHEEYLSEDMISYYRSLYQDLESGQHYLANLKIISNISYTIDSNYIEKRFNTQLREYICYIGNISKFQRVYKGKWNKQFYVKTLTPYKDEYYIEVISYSDKTYITNELTSPVFPCSIDTEGSFGVTYYTNTEGMNFTRDWNIYKYIKYYMIGIFSFIKWKRAMSLFLIKIGE